MTQYLQKNAILHFEKIYIRNGTITETTKKIINVIYIYDYYEFTNFKLFKSFRLNSQYKRFLRLIALLMKALIKETATAL